MSEKSFSVAERDFGHWDILIDGERRFTVRGEKRRFFVIDEKGTSDQRIEWSHKNFRSDLEALQEVVSHIVCELP
jgi:hypothetical protein